MVWRSVAAATALLCMQQAQAFQVTLKNQCSGSMTLFDSSSTETIAEGSSTTRTIAANSGAHVYRYGTGAQATLAEFSGDAGYAWYDISIIPTSSTQGPDYCSSLADCKAYTGGVGFNVAMQITPDSTDGNRCVQLNCPADGCDDAYQYPKDDTKTHTCSIDTDFTVTFCYTNSVSTPEPTTATPEPTTATPEPTTATPEPTTATPEPTTATPEPTTEVPSSSASGSVANEADGSWSLDSLAGSGSVTAGSASNSTSSEDAGESVASDYDIETTVKPSTSTSETTSDGAVAIGGSPSTTDSESASGSAEKANTQSGDTSSGSTGLVVLGIGAAASVAAVAAVYTIRKKKAELEEMENKTPIETGARSGTIVMSTPNGSMLL